MSYPQAQPPFQQPPQKVRLRGHTGIRVGLILTIVGLVLTIVGVVVLATQSLGKVDDFQRVSFSERTATITFDKAGDYVAYYESPKVTSDISFVPGILIEMRNKATRADVNLLRYGNNSNGKLDRLTYSYDGHHGVAYRQFHITTPGAYEVAVQPGTGADPNGDIAFGKSIATGTVVGAALTVIGVLILIAGVIVLIVGLVRRSRHKKQLRQYGPPPGYPGQGYPGQGYQGYPPQGYAPPGNPSSGYPPPGYPPPGPQYPPPAEPWPPKN